MTKKSAIAKIAATHAIGNKRRSGEIPAEMAVRTYICHMLFQLSAIPFADDFYVSALGSVPLVRTYPGALFVSAGDYHHHVGLNTWESAGSSPPPAGSTGLRAANSYSG